MRLVEVHEHFIVELERLLHPAVPTARTYINEIERANGVSEGAGECAATHGAVNGSCMYAV